MIPGPEQVVACPRCEGLAKYLTLVSGNTFGARVWSDGKQIAPMLPRPPGVVKCHHCGECYWLADAKEVGTIPSWGDNKQKVDAAWKAAQKVEEPSEEEYYDALAKGLAVNPQQETDARILAWWRSNDAFRDPGRADRTPMAAATRMNLEALARLLEEGDDNNLVMKAEVYRELGEFESARQALNRVKSADFAAVVRQLRTLCDGRDPFVREINFGG